MTARIALIGGSGFQRVPGFETTRTETVETPFGAPSDALQFGVLGAREWVFLRRHGDGHRIAPHRVNYRANLWALREVGAQRVVACAAVGGIAPALAVGDLVVPAQLIDFTYGRAHTFFDGDGINPRHSRSLLSGGGDINPRHPRSLLSGGGGDGDGDGDPSRHPRSLLSGGGVRHIDFSQPYNEALRAEILAAAARAGVAAVDGGVYAVTQGPRLETAAEIDQLARAGATIVGMTGMPEAALARELGLDYATVAIVVNPAAGRGPAIDMTQIAAHITTGAAKALTVLAEL